MTADDKNRQPAPRRRWALMLLVLLSLSLNVFLIGWMVGRDGGGVDWLPAAVSQLADDDNPRRAPQWLEDGLGDKGLRKFRTNWGEQKASLRPLMAERGPLRAEVSKALSANPFQPARYAAALAALRDHNLRLQTQIHTVMVDTAAQLSPVQRQKFMRHAHLMKTHKHHKRRQWWRQFDDNDDNDDDDDDD